MRLKLALMGFAALSCLAGSAANAAIVNVVAGGKLSGGSDGLKAGDPFLLNLSYDNAGPGEGDGYNFTYPGSFNVDFTLNGKSYHNGVNFLLETYTDGDRNVLGLGTPGDYTGERAEIEINLPSSYVPGGNLPTAKEFLGSFGTVSFDFIPNDNPETNYSFGNANFTIGTVPESATWAMMIFGFGLIGGVMRRKRNVIVSKVAFA
jgi:hypothetical protein